MKNYLRLFVVLLILVTPILGLTETSSNSNANERPPFEFPEYLIKEAKEQEQAFQKETGTLSVEEIKKAENRAKEAFLRGDWAVASSEYSRILGKQPEKRELWLRLGIATHNKNLQEHNYLVEQIAKRAAFQAYTLSQTKEDQAEALLVYGNTFNPAEDYEYPFYQATLEYAGSLTNLAKLRENKKELLGMMTFRYLKPRVNTDSTPPNACFVFSHPLETKNIHLSDYIQVNPKGDGNLSANGRELCLSNLQFGKTYDVTLKAGLFDIYGEKLKKDEKISFKVRDQDSRLSFNTRAYILKKDETSYIPLTGVNVDSVAIKILRVPERSLDFVVGQAKDFLSKLWDYRIDQISNETGELLYEGEMDFSKEKNKTVTKQVPFSDVIKNVETGVYIVQAEEKNVLFGAKASATQWLIVSDLALTTFTQSNGSITVNVRSLKTASPLANVELKLIAHNNNILQSIKTNSEGMAFFESNVTTGKGGNRPLMVLAYGPKNEFSFLSLDFPAFDLSDRGVEGRKTPGPLDAFLYTEQGVYRPGSTVHVNALLRNEKGMLSPKIPLTFKVLRSDETVVKTFNLSSNELGLYSFEIPLFDSVRTGQWTVLAFADPKKDPIGRCTFAVEDFVPSRIAVNLKTKSLRVSDKEPTNIEVEARYLFGFPAAGLRGDASLTLRPAANPLPKFSGFSFGLENDPFQNIRSEQEIPVLNAEGKAEYQLVLEKLPETSKPLEAVLRVTVADQGGRPEIGSLTLPVQTTPYLIGIKGAFKDKVLSEEDSEAKFEIITPDTAGQLIAVSDLQYEFFEENLQYTWYRPDNYSPWQYKTLVDAKFLQKGTLNSLNDKAQILSLPVKDWGQYRLEIKDPKTGAASSFRFQKGWLAIAEGVDSPDKLIVKVNKPLVKFDETLELQIESPFEGQALLTLANDRILETRNIELNKGANRVKLSANENWGVGVYCMISAVRPLGNDNNKASKDSKDNKNSDQSYLPKRAIGLAWIGIDPSGRTLDINFTLPKEVKPRQSVEIPLQVTRKDGKSLSLPLQMTVAAVDEGILKLTDFQLPKPANHFLGQRTLGVEQRDLYGRLIDPLAGEKGVLRQGGDAGLLSRNMQALSKRSFKIISLYKGIVQPDKAGKANVQFDLPNFNGSLRIMAVAFDDSRFGSGESTLLVRDPIVLEGVLPRFLAPNDISTFSLSLNNVSAPKGRYRLEIKTEGELKLAAKADSNADSAAGSSTKQDAGANSKVMDIELEKEGKADISIPLQAKALGTGKIQVILTGDGLNISNQYEISIREASPYESFTKAFILKPEETYRLTQSLDYYLPGSEQIILSLSTIVPWDIESIAKELALYAYGCVEQITSKGMGALVSNDKNHAERVNQAIALLSEKQLSSGAFSFWDPYGANGNPFLTSYVMDFYLTAKAAGFEIPTFSLNRGLENLTQMFDRSAELKGDDLSGLCYGLYVLTKADQIETGSLRYFYDTYYATLDNTFARSMVAAALALKNENDRANEAFRQVFPPRNNNNMNQYGPFGTALRNEAVLLSLALETLKVNSAVKEINEIMLDSMASIQKTLSQKIQKTTQAAKPGQAKAAEIEASYPLSTQEMAWILLASNRLNQISTNANAKTEIQVKLNDSLKQAKQSSLQIPLTTAELMQGLQLLNIGKENVFTKLSISAIAKEARKAESHGIEIAAEYYDLQGNSINPAEVKQGTQLLALLKGTQVEGNTKSHQLLLVDLLAAGFEIENAKITEENKPYTWLPQLTKTEYAEARDDRFVAAVEINENNNSFQVAYQLRAVTPGTYIKPGFFVEDMYTPTFFARTDAQKMNVILP